MEFQLTYQGPLYAIQRDPTNAQRDPRANHKHDLRRHFHKQLKRLWHITPYLKPDTYGRPMLRTREAAPHTIIALAQLHAHHAIGELPWSYQNCSLGYIALPRSVVRLSPGPLPVLSRTTRKIDPRAS